jgi:hypothetical protein
MATVIRIIIGIFCLFAAGFSLYGLTAEFTNNTPTEVLVGKAFLVLFAIFWSWLAWRILTRRIKRQSVAEMLDGIDLD